MVVEGSSEGYQPVSGLEEGARCSLAGERELGQGGTINSFFLQPKGRDSQLECSRPSLWAPCWPPGSSSGVTPIWGGPEAHLGNFSYDLALELKPVFLGHLPEALCPS